MNTEDILKKQDAEQAPPVASPTISNAVAEVRESKQETKSDVIEAEQKLLAELSESDAWKVLKGRLERKITRMRVAFSTRLSEGKIDLADVGIRSLIINEVSDAFMEVIKMVEAGKKQVIVQDLGTSEDLPDTVGLDASENS